LQRKEPTVPDALDFEANADAASFYTSLGVAVLPSHHPIALPGRSDHGRRLYACSCKAPDCARPACHPIGALTIEHATVNPDRVAAWWAASPEANIVTPAGHMLDFIELRRPLPAEHLTAWLAAHGIHAAPIIHSAAGSLRFPVRASEPATARYAPLSRGGVLRHAPESLILLPPSKRIDGHVSTWLRPFDQRTVILPVGEELFSALTQLPSDPDLHAWHHDQEPDPDGQLSGTRP
jgi:Bifunctional DNA primase/polymerase, N-terminal